MNRILRSMTFGALVLALAGTAFAQTQIDRTTFSTAVTAAATRVTLAAASGAAAGDFLYVQGEKIELTRNVSSTTWDVRRGLSDGATPASAHGTNATVWVGGGGEFRTYDVDGTCSQSTQRYLPHINTRNQRIFDCGGNGVWLERSRSLKDTGWASLICGGQLVCREEFNGGHLVMQDDGTVKSLSDAEENFVYGSPLGAIEYREEQAKTVSSWVTINGQLDISADDTTASEGVEIIFGAASDAALQQVIEVGTHGACMSAMVTIADISQVTQLQFGWRQNEAFQDAAAYTGYARWSTIGLTTTDGAITSSEEVSSSTTTDVSGITWADGERRALKVCISSTGAPTAYFSAASPDNDAPIYIPVTMTNTGVAQTSGTGMVPFMTFLAVGTTDAAVTIQWVQLEYAR
jgi:hypothetical protein